MHVLISGAGIGGVLLAGLLEKAGISYQVFEKAQEVKPLGSAISFGSNVLPVFRQLGIMGEIDRHSQPLMRFVRHFIPHRKEWDDDYSFMKERYGDYIRIIERPKLYDILRTLVPVDKILFSKKVLSIEQNDEGVMIRCSDNTTYHGDVLIGADGAYSAVRQAIYRTLKDKGTLPADDDTEPPFNTHCLVGVSRPFPPGTYEVAKGECRYESIFFRELPYLDGGIKWMVLQDAGNLKTRNDERFRNNEWGSEGAMTMADKVRDLPTPFGPTVGELIDNTPAEYISKVMLEEKLYTTWNHGRTALMGDACHKFFPYGGQGAINAMLDAVVLANVLQACATTRIADVRRSLDAYRAERFPGAQLAHAAVSKGAALCKRGFKGEMFRFIYRLVPRSVIISQWDNIYAYRPQAAFLPFIPPEGTAKPHEQTDYEYLKTSVAN
ncbi:hypothetical protein DFQ26_007193 [Actinomortierella ambigua]|nr:hypothetical protein DFQ26_007193 [Actinomortierella ambigua]